MTLSCVRVVHCGADACLSVQGDERGDIHEGDFATCTVAVHLERLHDTRPAGTPYMPAKGDEGWWLLLGDLASNTLFAVQKVRRVNTHKCAHKLLALMLPAVIQVPLRASVGLKRFRAAAKQGSLPAEVDSEGAQEFKLRFRAPQAGLFGLHVMCMSDTWIGCDARVPLKLKVRLAAALFALVSQPVLTRCASPGQQGQTGAGTCCCRRALDAHRR